MNCPHCQVSLLMTERKGIEIDYCAQCRGIWLDKGELDKIIDLSVGERFGADRSAPGRMKEHAPDMPPQSDRYQPHYRRDNRDARSGYSDYKRPYAKYNKYKKKKTLLGELFDIF